MNEVRRGLKRRLTPLHPRNNPNHLLRRNRIDNPSRHQSSHRDEQGPEHFLHLLILPKRIDDRIRIRLHRTLNRFWHENQEQKKKNRSSDTRSGDLGLPCKPDPGRDRNSPRQDTGHPHLPEPEVMPLLQHH